MWPPTDRNATLRGVFWLKGWLKSCHFNRCHSTHDDDIKVASYVSFFGALLKVICGNVGAEKKMHVITPNNCKCSEHDNCAVCKIEKYLSVFYNIVVGTYSHCPKPVLFLLRLTTLSLQERQRRYLSLSPWDKATLSLVNLKRTLRWLLYLFWCNFVTKSSSFLCLSGPCDSLQQDGQDCCFLLHPVLALFGLLGRSPSSMSSALMKQISTVRCDFISGAVQDCVEREYRQRLLRFLC